MRIQCPLGLARVLGAVVLLALPIAGCAAHRAAPPAVDASAPHQESSVDARLASYPLTTRLHIRLVSGERVDGVLLFVDEQTITVEVDPDEPAREIARASIAEVSSYTTAGHKAYWVFLYVGFALLLYAYFSGWFGPYG